MAGGNKDVPSSRVEESNQIFVDVIQRFVNSLDQIGLYVLDSNLEILTSSRVANLDDVRRKATHGEVQVRLNADCFIGNSAWRNIDTKRSFLEVLNEARYG